MVGRWENNYAAAGLSSILIVAGAVLLSFAQDPATRPRKVATEAQGASTPEKKPDASGPSATPKISSATLVEQGKTHYRAARFPQALAKFEAALKLDPQHDEALGLAAITAFRVDNQPLSQQYFLRRAELPEQKPSVKAFSFYRIALSHWRQVHDPVARSFTIKDGRVQFKVADADQSVITEHLAEGFKYADRALQVNANYGEAHNVRNLLYSEEALAAPGESDARKAVAQALEALRKAVKLQPHLAERAEPDPANFNLPTLRIGELPRTADEEKTFSDEMRKHLEGLLPVKRVSPVFPSTRPAKTQSQDPSATGVTDKGGAYSIGSGRGALTAAYEPGTVKVEVLISTTGDVVFAHVVDGRADLNGAAILAARGWKFAPPRFENAPVQVSGVITFDMKPPGSKATPTPTPKTPPR
jgi:tetratricopeptide (TPR) repeat protein